MPNNTSGKYSEHYTMPVPVGQAGTLINIDVKVIGQQVWFSLDHFKDMVKEVFRPSTYPSIAAEETLSNITEHTDKILRSKSKDKFFITLNRRRYVSFFGLCALGLNCYHIGGTTFEHELLTQFMRTYKEKQHKLVKQDDTYGSQMLLTLYNILNRYNYVEDDDTTFGIVDSMMNVLNYFPPFQLFPEQHGEKSKVQKRMEGRTVDTHDDTDLFFKREVQNDALRPSDIGHVTGLSSAHINRILQVKQLQNEDRCEKTDKLIWVSTDKAKLKGLVAKENKAGIKWKLGVLMYVAEVTPAERQVVDSYMAAEPRYVQPKRPTKKFL